MSATISAPKTGAGVDAICTELRDWVAAMVEDFRKADQWQGEEEALVMQESGAPLQLFDLLLNFLGALVVELLLVGSELLQ